MNALEVQLLNANGIGDYYQGIAADCPVLEDVNTELGNPEASLLGTALHYIESGSCPPINALNRSSTLFNDKSDSSHRLFSRPGFQSTGWY